MKTKFSVAQLSDWKSYEEVRLDGAYNMFDPRAREAAGLSRDEYLFVMQNYSELKEAFEKGQQ